MECEQVKLQFNQLQHQWHEHGELSIDARRERLERLMNLLQSHCQEIAVAVKEDFSHRSITETYFLEIFPTIQAIKYCKKHLKKWSKPRKKAISFLFKPAKAYVQPQALGVVGNMSPWNYPVYLALVPAIYALSAGNRVMIKFSELTPKTGKLLEELIHNWFPEGDFCIINGDIDVAKCFSSLPFGHLIFTGSTQVGRQIMATASHQLTPVTLELGGKSPAVISDICSENLLDRLLVGKCFNAGQTCIAPDYVLMSSALADKFPDIVRTFLSNRYANMPNDEHYSSIITSQHFQRLIDMVVDAKEKGATVIEFGVANQKAKKFPLTLIFQPTNDMKIMQEEIFGPILPVLTYEAFSDVIKTIKNHANPLVIYYFGNKQDDEKKESVKN